jgi:hypothetical protein
VLAVLCRRVAASEEVKVTNPTSNSGMEDALNGNFEHSGIVDISKDLSSPRIYPVALLGANPS